MNLDIEILQWFYQIRSPFLNGLMKLFSFLGSEVLIAGATFVLVVLLFKKHKREAFFLSFVVIATSLINSLLKNSIQRVRPQYFPLVTENGYSFPSGHAMNSLVFYMMMVYLLFHFTKKRKISFLLSIVVLGIIMMIGVSRVYLGIHYPSDVIAGNLGGLGLFMVFLFLSRFSFG